MLDFGDGKIEYRCGPHTLPENLMNIKNVRDYGSLIAGYEEKYQLTHSAIHLPARINSELKEKAIETAVKLYRIFDLKDYARIDLFVDRNNQIFFNEINTIPGFTEHSRFPKMMKAKGLNMKNILRRMIEEELC